MRIDEVGCRIKYGNAMPLFLSGCEVDIRGRFGDNWLDTSVQYRFFLSPDEQKKVRAVIDEAIKARLGDQVEIPNGKVS